VPREKILSAIDRGVRQVVSLKKPYPVFFVYWTAWVEENGNVQFRDDIYNRDARLRLALHNER